MALLEDVSCHLEAVEPQQAPHGNGPTGDLIPPPRTWLHIRSSGAGFLFAHDGRIPKHQMAECGPELFEFPGRSLVRGGVWGLEGKLKEFQKQNTLWKVDLAISVRSLPWAEGNEACPLRSCLSRPRPGLPCSPGLSPDPVCTVPSNPLHLVHGMSWT